MNLSRSRTQLTSSFAALTSIAFFLVISFSFRVRVAGDDFLKQLGLSKTEADQRISTSIMGGFINSYGLKAAKNIAVGDRNSVTNDLLVYIKTYVGSKEFTGKYETLRLENKPVAEVPQTPADMRKELIDTYKKSIAESETSVRTATGDLRKVLQDVIAESRKQLAEAQNPDNALIRTYESNYAELLKASEQEHAQALNNWKEEYPETAARFVKLRLSEFLESTEGIDFNAALTERNGKKYFTNPDYERKNSRWKMAFRAGREVVTPARTFVQKWIDEIK